jgi:hypothetical protein
MFRESNLLTLFRIRKDVPHWCKEFVTVSVYKKGGRTDCSNV